MYCPNCGTQLRPNARFCTKCGMMVDSPGAPGGQPPAAQSPSPQPPAGQPLYPQPPATQQPYPQPPATQQPYPQPPAAQPPYPQQPVPQSYQPVSQQNQPLTRPPTPGQPVAAGAAAASGGASTFPSFGQRGVAFLFDMLVVSLVVVMFAVATLAPLINTLRDVEKIKPFSAILAIVVGIISIAFLVWYPIILPRRTGQTLGKRLMNLRIVDWKTRTVPGMGILAARFYLGYPLSAIILGIGFLVPLWDDQKQALHDKLMKTNVIDA